MLIRVAKTKRIRIGERPICNRSRGAAMSLGGYPNKTKQKKVCNKMKSKMKNVKRTINRTIEDSDCSSMATLKSDEEREMSN